MNTRNARLRAGIATLTLFAGNAFAQPSDFEPKSISLALLRTVIFAAVAMVLLFIAFKLFDWATPSIHIQKELLNNNVAVAIMTASVILGVSLIVAVSIM